MEGSSSDDFFDIFRNATTSKTKKFSFKKVAKDINRSKIQEAVTSPFFAKSKENVSNRLTLDKSVEEQMSELFNGKSEYKEISNNCKKPTVNFQKDSSNCCDKVNDRNSNIASVFLLHKQSGKKVQPASIKAQNISDLCNDVTSLQCTKSTPTFSFKKNESDIPSQKKINSTKTATPLSNKTRNSVIISDSDDDFVSDSLRTRKLFKNIAPMSSNPSNSSKVLNINKSTTIKESNLCNSSTDVGSAISSASSKNVFVEKPDENIILENILESPSSPVLKPKKFPFRKKSSTSSSSSVSQFIDKTPENVETAKQQLSLSTDKSDKVPDCNSYISISSSDSFNEPNKKLFNSVNLDDNVVFVSQSLEATEADYMDDAEFERLFGGETTKIKCDNKSAPIEDDFNLGDVDWCEEFESENKTNKNLKNVPNEIVDVNWNEEIFADYTPVNSFKNRDDDSINFRKNDHFSEVILEVLHQKFGLRSFRPQQREIINASLNRHDCFVLMPTGGGKSLCYQLPAILSDGVTVVISPLRALISDQVDKLNALDISAAHLCADVSLQETSLIISKLHIREPQIKLLYLTPEKIMASKNVITVLTSLNKRGKLARFVLDEAHCLSQWGHDFRPDYKKLSILRKDYPDVPIICLTATATNQVENDVINILKLKDVKRFIRSFNRPNIKYQVLPKQGKDAVNQIAQLIKNKFFKKSGIIYCLARNDCDELADKLNIMGIKTRPYHAGMKDKIREAIQREWMQDKFYVIAATIAFGMGIDKPDVRFVIHSSIPKTVEAFYQESGRAGRDGEISYSYLFYSYKDVKRMQNLLRMDRNNFKTLDAQFENLKQMVLFAENVVDCRRYLQLIHLGEYFDRKQCIQNKATICDNCENINNVNTLDVTKEAKDLGSLVQDLTSRGNFTMLHIVAVYKGSKIKKIMEKAHNNHKLFGVGSNMDRSDIQRIMKDLILKNILADHHMHTGEFPVIYIKPGPNFSALKSENIKITIPVVKGCPKLITDTETSNRDVQIKPSTSKSPVKKTAQGSIYKINQIRVACHEELLEECRRLALEKNVTLSSIMNLSAIKTMSDVLPKTREEFLKIQHVTAANFKKFGECFLNITKTFRERIDALEANKPKTVYTSESIEDDDWDVRPSQKGIKRKYTWGGKRGGKKYKKTYKRTRAKKGNNYKKGSTRNTSGGKGAGSIGLMPVHIK